MKPFNFQDRTSAGFEGGKITAYYGPSEVDPLTGDWCMTITKNGKEVFRLTNTQLLEIAGNESPASLLIAGLSVYLNK